jgi:cholest-4-en-3-one 26-monooxygenase
LKSEPRGGIRSKTSFFRSLLGANLARLELKVMLDEVLDRLPDLELAGSVQRLYSNTVAGIKHMPVRFTPSRAAA